MPRKSASGSGTIRKKEITRGDKKYVYWEARYTEGIDPGTGRQIQRSISGKTQKEVSKKLKELTSSIDNGTYFAPNKITLGQWLDIWVKEYLNDIKPSTKAIYASQVDNHIKPSLGMAQLSKLDAHTVQRFYNSLMQKGLSPKTIKNIHGVLHKALDQAVSIKYINFNPSSGARLPRVTRPKLNALDDGQISDFLSAIKGHKFEALFTAALFTGMREGEILGLRWEQVDFENGTILIDKQLQYDRSSENVYSITTPKNNSSRTIRPASFIIDILKDVKNAQQGQKGFLADVWADSGFVFVNELGEHLSIRTVYKSFKAVAESIGLPELRFHDLRHSYAVASIRSGDDIKTVQENLGHATAAFTLDVYGHVTKDMQKISSSRMDNYIRQVLPK